MSENTDTSENEAVETERAENDGAQEETSLKSAPVDRATAGPFDDAEANRVRPYIDLGGIKIRPREGLNLRLEVEEKTQVLDRWTMVTS